MKLFIIGGKADTGKNVLAQMIKEYYEKREEKTIITEYSKYIKMYAMEILGTTKKDRKFLQDLGENIRKNIDHNFFIKRAQDDIGVYQAYFDNIVICDARLIPEITLMKTKYKNCYTIHLLGKESNNLSNDEKKHITELEFDNFEDFDYIISNDNLKEEITKILDDIERSEIK